MLNQKLMGNPAERQYVDDVFSTYLYTGNGSTQTINNGIDLAGKGGLAWTKSRGTASGHMLYDTLRGTNQFLATQTTIASTSSPGTLTFFNDDGFTLGASDNGNFSTNVPAVSWTFRRAPGFFDVVTYTGNGASNRQIAHGLGAEPGFITTKATSTTGDWNTYHRSATGDLKLNTQDAQAASRALITAAAADTFTVSGVANTSGVTYVAYLWAHDPGEDGIVQCGSFTTDSSGNATVNLGWEPQFLMVKTISAAQNWRMFDSMRGMPVGSADAQLIPNSSEAETASNFVEPSASGFNFIGSLSQTYIYLAIRRPNKPPKTGAEVFNPTVSAAGEGVAISTGFSPDMQFVFVRNFNLPQVRSVVDRLRGVSSTQESSGRNLRTNSTVGEITTDLTSRNWGNYGFEIPQSTGTTNSVYLSFRRCSGFFDQVCDTGTGTFKSIPHSLGVAPEFVIRKSRNFSTPWEVWHSSLGTDEKLLINSDASKIMDATAWGNTAPGEASFSVGTGVNVNNLGGTYTTYLFSTIGGISKVGSYTGNGSSQTIDCGFTTGARFILIKRTDSTGDWYVWDTARGIVAANDPHLSLNTTAAEVTTDDSVDPDASGFIVNQNTATNINVLDATYIFLAIA